MPNMMRLLPKALSLKRSVNKNTMAPVKVSNTIMPLNTRLINSIGDFFIVYVLFNNSFKNRVKITR